MILEITLCVIILRNLEVSIEGLLSKCEEVKKTHELDKITINNLLEEVKLLKNELSELKKSPKL